MCRELLKFAVENKWLLTQFPACLLPVSALLHIIQLSVAQLEPDVSLHGELWEIIEDLLGSLCTLEVVFQVRRQCQDWLQKGWKNYEWLILRSERSLQKNIIRLFLIYSFILITHLHLFSSECYGLGRRCSWWVRQCSVFYIWLFALGFKSHSWPRPSYTS